MDQFEEVLRYQKSQSQIWDQLSPLMNALNHPARVVLSLREDYLGILDELMNRVPGLMESRYRVQPLSVEAIQLAIREPLGKLEPPFEIEPALAAKIVDDFEARRQESTNDGRVEAGYLQLVCQRLWDIEKDKPARCLNLSTYETEGEIDRIVETHIERSLKDSLDGDQQRLFYAMTRYLVTPTGAKVALSVADLCGLIGEQDFSPAGREVSAALFRGPSGGTSEMSAQGIKSIGDVAEKLCAAEVLILRRKEFRKRISYELCHDVLGSVLLRWRARTVEEEVRTAQRQVEESERARKEAEEEARFARELATEQANQLRQASEKRIHEAKEGWTGAIGASIGFVAFSCITLIWMNYLVLTAD